MDTLAGFAVDYLVNALWMCLLVWLAAWPLSLLAARIGSRMEHAVWIAALWLEVLLPAVRINPAEIWQAITALLPMHGASANGKGMVTVLIGTLHPQGGIGLPSAVIIGLGVANACITLFFAIRLLVSLYRTHLLEQKAAPIELEPLQAAIWWRCCERTGVAGVEIAESVIVHGPSTVGLWRSTLVFPCGMLRRMQLEDLEAAMMHECAHIARRDVAKNLIYQAISLPLALHPIVRMTLGRIAETREMVCDAAAAEAVAGRESYARSLLRLAALIATPQPSKTVHAIGILDANTFERRVMRLTTAGSHAGRGLRLGAAALCLTVAAATCASALTLRLEVATGAADSAEQSSKPATTLKVPSGVMAGQVIYQKPPVYPAEVKAKGISGAVVLAVVISKEGTIQKLEVISGPEELRASAADAVKEWRYKPYLLNGDLTEVKTTITVNYQINK